MSTTTSSDVKIYQAEMQGAFIETIQQNVEAFNEQSGGCLQLNTQELKGQYEKEAFMDEVSSIARRDPAAESSSTVSSTKLTQDEFIGVKLARRNGPYEFNPGAAKLAGFDWRRFSITIGEQTAVATPQEMLDRALSALEAKLDGVSALEHDRTAGTIRTADLVTGLSKFGDQASRIRLFVMHSKVFWDLVAEQLASTASVLATLPWGGSLYAGMPVTLNRPVLVTDSASLIDYGDVSTDLPIYSTLGLVEGAAQIDITEAPFAVLEGPITGSENLYFRWQAEYSYNLKLKGCAYDTAAGANPTNGVIATAPAWITKVADNKLLPGVLIRSR